MEDTVDEHIQAFENLIPHFKDDASFQADENGHL